MCYFSDRSDDRRGLRSARLAELSAQRLPPTSAQRLPPTVVRCPLTDWGSRRLPGDTMVLSICTLYANFFYPCVVFWWE